NPAHYNLFNVRYVVAPHGLAMPAFLRRIKETPRYSLYQAETSGYAQFAALNGTNSISSQSSLFSQNRNWLLSTEPAAGRFIRYDSPADRGGSESPVKPGCPGGGTISEERVLPGRIDLRVECQQAATLVLKVTYHPNWRIAIDGHET